MKIPMMPKGVEHLTAGVHIAIIKCDVKIPMMPKGVEHLWLALVDWFSHCGEDSNDAERR